MDDPTPKARETTPLPRDHPDYQHPSATAPVEDILDAGDLAKMRDKLRAGHVVVVGSNGRIYTSPEPIGPPMTAEAEAFVESHLGEVRRLALNGISTRIEPDGSMMGSNPVGKIQLSMGPDPSFTADELAIMENAILAGGRVSVRPDGSIFTGHYPNDRKLTLEENQARLVSFRKMRESGDLQRLLDAGQTVQVVEERIEYGVLDYKLPPPIEFPEPGAPTDVVGTGTDAPAAEPKTATELAAEAQRLGAEAKTIREAGRKAYLEESKRVALERDAVARREWSAEQEAKAADQQVLREQRIAAEQKAIADKATKAAEKLSAEGKAAEAVEQRELAQMATDRAETATQREWSARDVATKLRAEAEQLGDKKVELEAQLKRIEQRQEWADKAADGREQRAQLLESASKQIAEADRLDQEAAKAQADGDSEAARDIKRAADYTRSLGEADRAKAFEIDLPSVQPMGEGSGAEPVRLPPPLSPDLDRSRGAFGAADVDPVLGPPTDAVASADGSTGTAAAVASTTGAGAATADAATAEAALTDAVLGDAALAHAAVGESTVDGESPSGGAVGSGDTTGVDAADVAGLDTGEAVAASDGATAEGGDAVGATDDALAATGEAVLDGALDDAIQPDVAVAEADVGGVTGGDLSADPEASMAGISGSEASVDDDLAAPPDDLSSDDALA